MKSLDIYSNLVPSNINCICMVVKDLICNLQSCLGRLDDATLFELKVVLNEVLVNAIKHGNKEDEEKKIAIRAYISRHDKLYIIIEDEGRGYDFAHACNEHKPVRDAESYEISESGRGIMIIKSLCDSIKVNAKGNRIVVMKRIGRICPEKDRFQ